MISVKEKVIFWRIVAFIFLCDNLYLRWFIEQDDYLELNIELFTIRLMSFEMILIIVVLVVIFVAKFFKPFCLKFMGIGKDAK